MGLAASGFPVLEEGPVMADVLGTSSVSDFACVGISLTVGTFFGGGPALC